MMDAIILATLPGDVRDRDVVSGRQARGDPAMAPPGNDTRGIETSGPAARSRGASASAAAETGTADAERVASALRDLKNRIRSDTTTLRLRLDGESGTIQAEIVDAATDKVIRKIPSDEMLRLAAAIRQGSSAAIYDATA